MNKDSLVLPPRWKAGCWTLFMAWFVCAVLRKVAFGIGWLFQEMDGLPPVAAAILEVVAVVLLAPSAVIALIYLFRDWRETLARVAAFWLIGFRVGVIGLLLVLPFLIVDQMSERLEKAGVIKGGSPSGWLALLLWSALLLLAPFWTWAVVRRLPQTFLGRGLFDASDLDRIEQNPEL